jgi:hypothetical protein
LEFELFRIQSYQYSQGKHLEALKPAREALLKTVKLLSVTELRRGMSWYIGNVCELGKHGLYFRIGRIAQASRELYHEGRFEDVEFETAPYTHVLLDTSLMLCAIAKKTKLGSLTAPVVRQLASHLNESDANSEKRERFNITPVRDPKEFLTNLQGARSIQKFWIVFPKSDEPDIKDEYYKKIQSILTLASGCKCKLELEGSNLKTDALEKLVRIAASIGTETGAVLQPLKMWQKVYRTLKNNPVIYISSLDIREDKTKLRMLSDIRKTYDQVRYGNSSA